MASPFLPWVVWIEFFEPLGRTQNGFNTGRIWGNGVMMLVLGATIIATGISTAVPTAARAARWVAISVAAVILLIAVHDAAQIIDRVTLFSDVVGEPDGSIGAGIYVLMLGAGVAILGAILIGRLSPTPE